MRVLIGSDVCDLNQSPALARVDLIEGRSYSGPKGRISGIISHQS